MAKTFGDDRKPSWPIGLGKPKGRRTNKRWHRACLDAASRIEIYSQQSGEEEGLGAAMDDWHSHDCSEQLPCDGEVWVQVEWIDEPGVTTRTVARVLNWKMVNRWRLSDKAKKD